MLDPAALQQAVSRADINVVIYGDPLLRSALQSDALYHYTTHDVMHLGQSTLVVTSGSESRETVPIAWRYHSDFG